MSDAAARPNLADVVRRVEPASRLVPARALRRAVRLSRDRGDFQTRAVHDRAWWVRRDALFQLLLPAEFGLDPDDPATELLLLPAPAEGADPPSEAAVWRTLFHAALDREIDRAFADGRLTADAVQAARRALGVAGWHSVRAVLEEENLIARSDPDREAFREFVTFGLELSEFAPDDWPVYFPGVSPDARPLQLIRRLVDVGAIRERMRPEGWPESVAPARTGSGPEIEVPVRVELTDRGRAQVAACLARNNDLGAALLLHTAGDPGAEAHLDRLVSRLQALFDLPAEEASAWQAAVRDLLPQAAAGGWPVERRLLYELQRACLAVERPTYAADLVEWAVTVGRRPVKRLLTKPRWLDAARHLRAALRYADRLTGKRPGAGSLAHRIEGAVHVAEEKARADLRPEIVAVLDEVGLMPESAAEQRSRDKLVEELLDGACARGFLRLGDLRDAIARNRVKLPDLRGPGELVTGDPLIRANRKLAVRLDGVYRRGEVYMRLLQRGCSVLFGTRVGRWLTRYVALPFGGAFVILEGFHHMVEAGEGFVNWVTGWNRTVDSFAAVAGSAAGHVAGHPHAGGGTNWPAILGLGLFLLLLIHWPAFRTQAARLAKLVFVKVPRAVRRSAVIRALLFNPVTRFARRYLLVPVVFGAAAGLGLWLVSRDAAGAGLVGGGVTLLMATFFRTPLGHLVEDRLDEAAERLWRVVSVNFVAGVLTLILQFFQAIFEAIDRAIYVVDDWLRFREGQGRAAFLFKLLFGAVWFLLTYLFRFAWTLLVEPQINPIKHFPVVTVSHKMLLPLIPSLSRQFGVPPETMTTIVFGIPGIFGFLVWELKENWRLYRANAPAALRPAVVGSHGERVRRLLRPGFHSGVLPKTFAKLRRAARAGKARRMAKHRHTLDHVAEGVHRFVERDFVAYLRSSRRWGRLGVYAGRPELSPNRVRLPVAWDGASTPTVIAFEERGGWVIASVDAVGSLAELTGERRAAFEDALTGLYKGAGVDLVREQVARVVGPEARDFDAVPEELVVPGPDGTEQVFDYDDGPELRAPSRALPTGRVIFSARPLPWSDWAARWESDAAGKSPRDPLLPGWHLLPDLPAADGPPGGDHEPAERDPEGV